MRSLVLALMILALTGCTIGRTYNGSPLRGDPARILRGQSSRQDVLALLGPPDVIEHQTSGDAFIYRYRRANYSAIRIYDPFFLRQTVFSFSREFSDSDTLVVLFDFAGIVQGIGRDQKTNDLPIL